MKKRWTFSPEPFIALWFVIGLAALFIVGALTNGCYTESDGSKRCGVNGPFSKWSILTVVIWLGPFALVALGAATFVSIRGLWNARPRRVIEAITDDLRSIHPVKVDDK